VDSKFNFGWADSTGSVIPVPGDWNGDGKTEVGVYCQGAWFRALDATATTMAPVTYLGWWVADPKTVIPVPGDWGGDQKTDMGVYCNGAWFRDTTGSGAWDGGWSYWGWYPTPQSTPVPLVGDWNWDGKDELGIYALGAWFRDADSTHDWDAANQQALAYYGWQGDVRPFAGAWLGEGSLLTTADGAVPEASSVSTLTQTELQPIVTEALARWTAAGANTQALAAMKQVQFIVTDLPGADLGLAQANRVHLDIDAAGHGWFVDPTPASDEEFGPSAGGQLLKTVDPRAVDQIDLLTVVEHELGHVVGLKDLDALTDDLMSGVLGRGLRRHASQTDAAFALT
jgi:hypothetical protein